MNKRPSCLSPTPPSLKDIGKTSAQFRYSSYNMNDLDKKRVLIQRVPLLQQILSSVNCQEDELIDALARVVHNEGDHIFTEGEYKRALYFVESGQVVVTQRRAKQISSFASLVASLSANHVEKVEIQRWTYRPHDTFGEISLLFDGYGAFDAVATAIDTTVCYKIEDEKALEWFTPLLPLLWFRYHLRLGNVLDSCCLFRKFTALQLQYILDHCQVQTFKHEDYICRKGEWDDRFFIVVQGAAKICVDEPTIHTNDSDIDGEDAIWSYNADEHKRIPDVAAVKELFQCFGEMGLLKRQRTADVIATLSSCASRQEAVQLPPHILKKCSDFVRFTGVACIVIRQEVYNSALQMKHIVADKNMLDTLAYSLEQEWKISDSVRNLQIHNPKIIRHLVAFVRHVREACNAKVAGQNVYLELHKSLNDVGSMLSSDFDSVAGKLGRSPVLSSLCILRAEVRRILLLSSAARNESDIAFIARLIECTRLLNLFEVPKYMDINKVSTQLAKYISFSHVTQDTVIFKQGKIDSSAFIILRGNVNIVIEEVGFSNSTESTPSVPVVKQEVIAVLPSGFIFGELALVASLPRSATAIAASDCDFLMIEKTHIAAICKCIPKVTVRHALSKRADILSKLGFFRDCSFAQCYRMAHDTREQVYDPRTVFPSHSTSLYIVQEGEVAVFLNRPIIQAVEKKASDLLLLQKSSSVHLRNTSSRASESRNRIGLVRVAIIGTSEIFATESVALLNAATLISPDIDQQLSDVTYMCQSGVKVFEIPQTCWRRLPVQVLQLITNLFAERHRWNEACLWKQQYPVYFAPEKPWLLVYRSLVFEKSASAIVPTSVHPKSCRCKQCTCMTMTNSQKRTTSKFLSRLQETNLEITRYARRIIRSGKARKPKQGRICLTTLTASSKLSENTHFSMGRSPLAIDIPLNGSFSGSRGTSLKVALPGAATS